MMYNIISINYFLIFLKLFFKPDIFLIKELSMEG